jgi:hypothetical protein
LRYGLVGAFETNRPIKAGEQIFSDYGYINVRQIRAYPYEWFYDEWQDFKAKNPDHLKVKQFSLVETNKPIRL